MPVAKWSVSSLCMLAQPRRKQWQEAAGSEHASDLRTVSARLRSDEVVGVTVKIPHPLCEV